MSDDETDSILRHADDVWRTLYRLLNDPDDARECYQQTFLEAIKLDDSGVADWRALLKRIATCRAMDVLRERYRRKQVFSDVDVPEPLFELPPESELEFAELRETVRQLLATLPDRQAEAFVLRHIEQLTPAEIGEQLGLPPSHVRVLIHRALKSLRQSLPKSLHPISTLAQENADE
ncbi:MAG: sigma-70 family RNA polymerase sigma factor [Planctomycetota bacterium]